MSHSFWKTLPAIALAGATLTGCAYDSFSREPQPAPTRVVRWTSLLCTPTAGEIDITVQDAPMGTRVVLQSNSPTTAVALRESLWNHARPVESQAPERVVMSSTALPEDTRIRIENLLYGAAITYIGSSAAEERTIRNVVGPLARDLKSGQCTLLEGVGWAAPETG